MIIYDVYWTNRVNMLRVNCDCGTYFHWQTNISLITCPKCGYQEWWHSDALDYPNGLNFKVAKMNLKR